MTEFGDLITNCFEEQQQLLSVLLDDLKTNRCVDTLTMEELRAIQRTISHVSQTIKTQLDEHYPEIDAYSTLVRENALMFSLTSMLTAEGGEQQRTLTAASYTNTLIFKSLSTALKGLARKLRAQTTELNTIPDTLHFAEPASKLSARPARWICEFKKVTERCFADLTAYKHVTELSCCLLESLANAAGVLQPSSVLFHINGEALGQDEWTVDNIQQHGESFFCAPEFVREMVCAELTAGRSSYTLQSLLDSISTFMGDALSFYGSVTCSADDSTSGLIDKSI